MITLTCAEPSRNTRFIHLFEFYQMSNQSGQRSEMLGGCLNHPIHPSRRPDSQYTWRRVRSIA
jgi:hypothetical protein